MEKRLRKKRTSRDYSVAFKLQVVREIERGELNYDQADRKYGIQGHVTVSKWMKKYGSLAWKQAPTVSHKKTPEPANQRTRRTSGSRKREGISAQYRYRCC
jgi:transposase